jgi:hypothetical protein
MALIKFFESTDAGAPTLNNAVGSMIAVLDACGVTGYNTKAVTSITVANGVATVVCAAHGFANTYGKIILIAGSTPAGLNIETRISNVTTNGFTFLCPGVADGVATGTITAKYAPFGLVKQFTGTNKTMYKRADMTAFSPMLRIDDTAVGLICRALMVQSATDIDTYNNPAPLAAQIAGGLGQYWSKGYNNATPANWFIVADDKLFYLFVETTSGGGIYGAYGFGDAIDFKPGSTLGCELWGAYDVNAQNNYGILNGENRLGTWVISGSKNGISTSANLIIETKLQSNYGLGGPIYPSDVDGGLVIQYPVLFNEGTADGHRRGIQPGLAVPLANISNALLSKQQITNTIGSSRVFLVVRCSINNNTGLTYCPLIDLTGPWR